MRLIRDAVARLASREDTFYRQMLSGDPKRRQSAQKSIATISAALEKQLVKLQALTVLDDVKSWLGNEDLTKDIAFLDDLKARADKLVAVSWEVEWIKARAYRVAGRFEKAFNNYESAKATVDKKIKTDPPVDRMYDFYADYAEYLVYLGDPAEALNMIATSIPSAKRLSWHHWVMAFAHHQNAFAQKHPLGTLPSGAPGDAKYYGESNAAIDEALKTTSAITKPLEPPERCDIELLRIANFGALWRRGDGDGSEEAAAGAALIRFRGSNASGQNQSWTLQKERRGRFVTIYRKKLYDPKKYGKLKKKDVERWQLAYQQHFFDNLNMGDIIPDYNYSTDGDIDRTEDHPDDYGK